LRPARGAARARGDGERAAAQQRLSCPSASICDFIGRDMPCPRGKPGTTALRLAVLLPALLCATACGSGGDGQAESLRPPHARFDSRTYDFGSVEQGSVVRHSFRLRNQGDVDLTLVGTRTACDCAASMTGSETVAPGAAGAIDVTFDTAAVHGAQKRTVTVYTNDPNRRVSLLTLRGEVELDVAVSPSELYVGGLPRGAPIEAQVTFLSRNGARRLTSVESSGGIVRAEPLEDGRLALAVSPDAPLGDFAEDILLYTTSHRRPLLRLNVRGRVEADVVASPAALEFGAGRETNPVRHALIMNLRPDRPVHVIDAELDEALGRAEVETVVEGLRYRVRVQLSEGLAAGEHQGVVVLRTNHPEQPRIELPLHALTGPQSGDSPGNERRGGAAG
jgi:Protein of unknown function (DUF1573)